MYENAAPLCVGGQAALFSLVTLYAQYRLFYGNEA